MTTPGNPWQPDQQYGYDYQSTGYAQPAPTQPSYEPQQSYQQLQPDYPPSAYPNYQQSGYPQPNYPQQTMYPAAPGYQYGPPPENYLVWAILTTIFCFLPLGIPAIVFSTQVNSKWMLGDAAGALDSSKKAKTFAKWSAIVAGIMWAVGILFYIILIVGIVTHMPY
ncbi:MAG: CD225/dispanin family protein [Propionibacteriaceae bacterium]|nr:CD225/dispanin family protein [Propionibacteriaceae bacterium]